MKRPILFLGFVVLLSGCSPRLSPLYRDYDAGPEVMTEDSSEVDDGTSIMARIRSALVEAGWEVVEPVTPMSWPHPHERSGSGGSTRLRFSWRLLR